MAKYLVETYYTCSFKVSHYLDDVNEQNLQSLEKREDGKFEILDVKLDNRKTKNLEKIDNKNSNKIDSTVITPVLDNNPKQTSKINDGFKNNLSDKLSKRFSMPDRRKATFKRQLLEIIKYIFILESMKMVKLEKFLLIQVKKVN